MTKLMKSTDKVLILPGAVVCGDVALGDGVSIWFNAVLRGDEGTITLGENTNIQDCCVLHGRTALGKNVTVGHNAIVHACTVGDNCLIGMGSIIMNDAVIGDNCIIGAGALITKKTVIPAGSLVFGSPARVIRSLTEEEIAGIAKNAEVYLELADRWR